MRTKIQDIQWCPGCGDFMIMAAVRKVVASHPSGKHNFVVVSGIGCSGKMSQYIDCYGAETLHGRSIPFAIGVKKANPHLHVLCIAGDGDCYGIGLSHFLHAARRNDDITLVVCDNQNYALTTGQASPTTPLGAKTKSTPDGNTYAPFDPVQLASTAGSGFSRSVDAVQMKLVYDTIYEAVQYQGFSHVHVTQPCPSRKRR